MKELTVKDNLKILIAFILVMAIGALLFLGVSTLFIGAIYKPWIASIIILLAFLIVILSMKARASWKQFGMLIVCITAFVGCFFDIQGNYIYNLPIEWIYRDMGSLNILNETERIGSEYIRNYAFQIVDGNEAVVNNISELVIGVFRFFEYLLIYSLILTIFNPLISKNRKHIPEAIVATEKEWDNWEERQKQEMHTRKQNAIDGRQINSDIEEMIKKLVREGKSIQAIKVVREHTSFSLKEAKDLVDTINISSP